MRALPVNEIFETIQGEATFTGTPSIFLRLQGCDVGCPWCDTKYTWSLSPSLIEDQQTVINKTYDSARHAVMEPSAICKVIVERYRARHIVITGGEPFLHDLFELTRELFDLGKTVQVETSGTRQARADDRCWVTVSPKIDMPGGLKMLRDAVDRANEIKFPIGRARDIGKLDRFLADFEVPADMPIWIQPLSQSDHATQICISAALERGWRVSAQVHKFLNLR